MEQVHVSAAQCKWLSNRTSCQHRPPFSLSIYNYRRDSRVLLMHRACARCSTPSSPTALWVRLQKRQQRQWSHANMTHWSPGCDAYFKDLRDVFVCSPSAMALAPRDVTLHHSRLLWRAPLHSHRTSIRQHAHVAICMLHTNIPWYSLLIILLCVVWEMAYKGMALDIIFSTFIHTVVFTRVGTVGAPSEALEWRYAWKSGARRCSTDVSWHPLLL